MLGNENILSKKGRLVMAGKLSVPELLISVGNKKKEPCCSEAENFRIYIHILHTKVGNYVITVTLQQVITTTTDTYAR